MEFFRFSMLFTVKTTFLGYQDTFCCPMCACAEIHRFVESQIGHLNNENHTSQYLQNVVLAVESMLKRKNSMWIMFLNVWAALAVIRRQISDI